MSVLPNMAAAKWVSQGPLRGGSGGLARATRFQAWFDESSWSGHTQCPATYRAAWTAFLAETRLALQPRGSVNAR